MRVRVKGYLTFREVIGTQQLQFADQQTTTVRDLLEALAKEIGVEFAEMVFDPQTRKLSSHIAVLLNGRHCSHLPEGLETVLSDRDEVAIFPPIAGG